MCKCVLLLPALPAVLITLPSPVTLLSYLHWHCLSGLASCVLLLSLLACQACLVYETNQMFSLSLSFSPEFFAELSRATSALALTSSLTDLVHYIRQGLQWLRLEANMP